jgi:aspartate/methionine/tyrosine aminotransferase
MIMMAQQVPGVITLGRGDPDLDTPHHIIKAAQQSLEEGYTHYTAWAGMPELRRAIAEKLKVDNGITVDPNGEVLVTVGAQEAIFVTMFTILNPGDEIIVPEPRYTPYDSSIKLAGGKIVPLVTKAEDGFQVLARDVEKLITPRTKAILLISPNNPTGTAITRQNLEELAAVAQRHDLLVVSDELYEKLVFDGFKPYSMAALPQMAERTITVNGMSKAYSMTGWRVGYVAGPRELISPMNELKYAITICTPVASQRAALAALTGPQECIKETVGIYDQRRELAMNRLDRLGIKYVVPRGTFYVFADIRKFGMISFQFCTFMLEKAKVLIFPGTVFGAAGEGFIRISLLTSLEQLEEAFDRMEKVIELLK